MIRASQLKGPKPLSATGRQAGATGVTGRRESSVAPLALLSLAMSSRQRRVAADL